MDLIPAVGGSVRAFSPPLRFKPIRGDVLESAVCSSGPFGNVRKLRGTAAQRKGQAYERKVQTALKDKIPSYQAGPWFRFTDENGRRWCQPDGLLLQDDWAAIFEIKYTYTADAWWQLRRLYEPVVRAAYRPRLVRLLVVCRVFDPHVSLPEDIRLRGKSSLGEWDDSPLITVVPWRL